MTLPPIIGAVIPVVDYGIRKVCKRAYAGHPHGCPNWKRRSSCPPQAPSLHKIISLADPIYAIINAFPLKQHMDLMQAKHPQWTDRQLRNPLYWQGTARKQLKATIQQFLQTHPDYLVLRCPEACGVLLTKTVAPLGIALQWPPQELSYQIVLGGRPLRGVAQRYPDFAMDNYWGNATEYGRLSTVTSIFF